jgi:hypothetical protein
LVSRPGGTSFIHASQGQVLAGMTGYGSLVLSGIDGQGAEQDVQQGTAEIHAEERIKQPRQQWWWL